MDLMEYFDDEVSVTTPKIHLVAGKRWNGRLFWRRDLSSLPSPILAEFERAEKFWRSRCPFVSDRGRSCLAARIKLLALSFRCGAGDLKVERRRPMGRGLRQFVCKSSELGARRGRCWRFWFRPWC